MARPSKANSDNPDDGGNAVSTTEEVSGNEDDSEEEEVDIEEEKDDPPEGRMYSSTERKKAIRQLREEYVDEQCKKKKLTRSGRLQLFRCLEGKLVLRAVAKDHSINFGTWFDDIPGFTLWRELKERLAK